MRSTSPREANDPATAPAPLLREGELLGGKYRIERCLGGGGMASVHRARHCVLDQPVAIKVVSPHVRELPGVVPRFMREARAATRLKSEHVVRVFDVGTTEDGSPYLVMELLEGKDLGELLDEGFTPSLEEAIEYTLQTCEALAEVHGLGIVHRDLKPANLFVTRGADGLACLKLIDFGISRVDSPLSPHDTISLTHPDIVMGSPHYMPPEQMESAAAADSRSDIWSVGAILYELLVGRAPFDGESLFDIYAAAVREPPARPSACRKGIPEGLDEVVFRCLRVAPAERWADVAALAAALAPFGGANAATRAESIARVLETSRARGGGDPESANADASKASSSSETRRSRASLRRRVLHVALGSATLLLVAAGLAARPIREQLERLEVWPGVRVTVTGAAAATTTAQPDPPAPPGASAPADTSAALPATMPEDPAAASFDDSSSEGAEPATTASAPSADRRTRPAAPVRATPPRRARPRATPSRSERGAVPAATAHARPDADADATRDSAPRPEPAPAQVDDGRTLFEERK